MEFNNIALSAQRMTNKQDLLDLLNELKLSYMKELGLEDKFHPFTMKLLNYYCNPNNRFRRFKQFSINKRTGGKRLITAPNNRSYKLMLRCVNEIFKSCYTPSAYAMGFTEGRSVVTNALHHKGQNYVFNIDLKDFFPSVEQARVWKRLQLAPFNFSQTVASLLAGMCSLKEDRTLENGEKTTHYVLPQGSPTSPILTNMICDNLDRRLAGLAKRFHLKFTRYADDITFSSMHNVYHEAGDFRTELQRIITEQGFQIKDSKTRLQKKGARQEVTGIIVSDKLNVSQKYVRDIRNILYIWDRYGYTIAYTKFMPKYVEEKGHLKKGVPDMLSVLDGKLMYLKMVKGDTDSVYLRLHAKYQHLVEKTKGDNTPSTQVLTYVDTYSIADFEKKLGQSIRWDLSIEPRVAYFFLAKKKVKVYISKSLTSDELKAKNGVYISNCRDAKGKEFWLLHRENKNHTIKQVESVDVDSLNKDLDSLLNTFSL